MFLIGFLDFYIYFHDYIDNSESNDSVAGLQDPSKSQITNKAILEES